MRILPNDPKERKEFPIYAGFLKYFPDAAAYVSRISWLGGKQHNPGKPLFWDRAKSTDQADTLLRHQLQWDQFDADGSLHAGKVAWRALAQLQLELERRLGEGLPVWKRPVDEEKEAIEEFLKWARADNPLTNDPQVITCYGIWGGDDDATVA